MKGWGCGQSGSSRQKSRGSGHFLELLFVLGVDVVGTNSEV